MSGASTRSGSERSVKGLESPTRNAGCLDSERARLVPRAPASSGLPPVLSRATERSSFSRAALFILCGALVRMVQFPRLWQLQPQACT
jgi:hypothetical protein